MCRQSPRDKKNDLISNVTSAEAEEPGSGFLGCRPAGQAAEAGERKEDALFTNEVQKERCDSQRNVVHPDNGTSFSLIEEEILHDAVTVLDVTELCT